MTVLSAFLAAEGDYRDWKAVAEWADTIADALSEPRLGSRIR